MDSVDQKYEFLGINKESGKEISDEDCIVFKASDNAVLPMLQCYLLACIDLKCSPAQIECIRDLIVRVEKWRENNPELCKVADVTEKEAAMILGQPF